MKNEIIQSITYITLIYAIWTAGITALVAALAKRKGWKYLWIVYGVTMTLITFFLVDVIVALTSLI